MKGSVGDALGVAPDGVSKPNRCLVVPTFRGRVAPVLDTCTCLMVMDLNKIPPAMREVQVGATTISGRTQELLHLGVSVIICGALSDPYFSLLKGKGIWMICGIAGDVEVVVAAFLDGTLARPCFLMPGADQGFAPREQNET